MLCFDKFNKSYTMYKQLYPYCARPAPADLSPQNTITPSNLTTIVTTLRNKLYWTLPMGIWRFTSINL